MKNKIQKFYDEFQHPEVCLDILKLIAEYRYIPVEIDLIKNKLGNLKKWKIKSAIKQLKAKGYIQAIAIDCDNLYNRKDTLTFTKKGTHFFNALGIELNANWNSFAQSKSLNRNRAIGDFMFANIDGYFNSKIITYGKNCDYNQYRGLKTIGFFFGEEDYYSVYSLNGFNINVHSEREHSALDRMNLSLPIPRPYSRKFNRIIIVDTPANVKQLLNTKKDAKWLKRGKKFVRHDFNKALFQLNELQYKGSAYIVPRNKIGIKQLQLFGNAKRSTEILNTHIIEGYQISGSIKGDVISNKKYNNSTFETDQIVVFNLMIFDLHIMATIQKIINENSEKRDVIVYVTEQDCSFIKDCFDNDNIYFHKIKTV